MDDRNVAYVVGRAIFRAVKRYAIVRRRIRPQDYKSCGAEGNKLFSNANWKNVETFLKYGIQSTAYDFAQTEKKYFWGEDGKGGREWYEHVGMFAAGGAAGIASGHFFTDGSIENRYARIAFGAGINSLEWVATSRIKWQSYARYNGYNPGGFYTGRSQTAKGWILGGKWLDQSINILGW